MCWASPAPAAGTCFCCSLTFLWHCAECCLKRRECSQMIIIYPAGLRSSVWMLRKNIKPESHNSEGCSLRIILNTLATKWSPWQQVHAQWKSAHPPGPCHPLNTCSATRENTMCSPPHHPHCSSVPANGQEARNCLSVSMGVNISFESVRLVICSFGKCVTRSILC